MARWTRPDDHYLPITMRQTRVVAMADSCAFLAELGLDGEFVHTPWQALADRGATTVHARHGLPFALARVWPPREP